MTLYVICHDEDGDLRIWRDDYTGIVPLFRTKTAAFNHLKKVFGPDKTYKRRRVPLNETSGEVFRKGEKGFCYRCAILTCKVMEEKE